VTENFADHSGLRRTCRITWFALNQLSAVYVQHFFNWSCDAVVADAVVPADDILSVCLFAFLLKPLKQNNKVHSHRICREIVLPSCRAFVMLLLQKL